MKALLRSIAVAALIGAVLTLINQVAAVSFATPTGISAPAGSYVADEVLVKFKPVYSQQQSISAVAVRGHSVLATLDQRGWVQVKIGAGQTMDQAIAAYQNNPDVEFAQPNYIYSTTAAPNDSQYGQLWAFNNVGQPINISTYASASGTPGADMNIEKAWDHITDCSSVVVAILDTGVNYNHEDLAANMWSGDLIYPNHGYDFVANDNDPMDLNGHGTHVAGIIGAIGNNATGTTGVCWRASLMAVRVLDATGKGNTASVIQGINFAVTHGAKVINMSLVGTSFDPAFNNAVSNAQSNDVVVIVAAGNDTRNNDAGGTARYPCNFTHSNLICVTALDQDYALASFSNWGATSVDVGAPGTSILSSIAGSVETTTDPLTGWTISGGWTRVVDGGNDWLVNPANFLVAKYGAGLTQTAAKWFDFSAAATVTLSFYAAVNLANSGDSFVVGADSNGANPFGAGALQLGFVGPVQDGSQTPLRTLDISGCAGHASCLIAFKLATGTTTPGDFGVGITSLFIKTLTLTTNTFQIYNGTSMATAEVAGLAALLRAYNPQYSYAEVVNAIKYGGRSVAALNEKTTTGNAIDVMSSLAYVNPPTGLTATVQ